jgi:DNA-binding transcriptional ArsR family regulator
MTPGDDQDEELWSALGDPMRLRLLDLLLEHDDATASALARTLPITRQAIAKHLTVLERAGLVAPRRVGREARFSVRPERLEQARRQMAQVASRWDRRLVSIKRLAEEAHRAPGGGGDDQSHAT